MTSSASNNGGLVVQAVRVTDSALVVLLGDGRIVSAPLDWFPRLVHATRGERSAWRLIGGGLGIRWESLDEDISAEGLLAGKRSGESLKSIKKWLAERAGRTIRHRRIESDARTPTARSRPTRRKRKSAQEARR